MLCNYFIKISTDADNHKRAVITSLFCSRILKKGDRNLNGMLALALYFQHVLVNAWPHCTALVQPNSEIEMQRDARCDASDHDGRCARAINTWKLKITTWPWMSLCNCDQSLGGHRSPIIC